MAEGAPKQVLLIAPDLLGESLSLQLTSEDPNIEIPYSEAIKIDSDFEIGEEVTEEFKFADFGRRNVLSLRQNLMSRIMDLEKDYLYKLYKYQKDGTDKHKR